MSRYKSVLKAIEHDNGILRLAPAWVTRSFLFSGRRLKLDPRDLYALGAHRGGICERWLASVTQADNGPGTPADEGLSYVVVDEGDAEKKILLQEALSLARDELIGKGSGGWDLLTKFYDSTGPIPFHMHQMEEHAKRVGRQSKPEGSYFPRQLNFIENSFPYTFLGFKPSTTVTEVKTCLANWNRGDNEILKLSQAHQLELGTGWNMPAGIAHAPGSLVTYETQKASDVFAALQSVLEGRPLSRDLLVKDVPEEFHDNLDYLVGMLDWEANLTADFAKEFLCRPTVVAGDDGADYVEKQIIYGSDQFSAKELTLRPQASVHIKDASAYGLIAIQGWGKIESLPIETPTMIRYGQMTNDEFFVTHAKACEGVKMVNRSNTENLVILKHFSVAAHT